MMVTAVLVRSVIILSSHSDAGVITITSSSVVVLTVAATCNDIDTVDVDVDVDDVVNNTGWCTGTSSTT